MIKCFNDVFKNTKKKYISQDEVSVMANSAVRYKDKERYITDGILSLLLEDVKNKLEKAYGSLEKESKLIKAYKVWKDVNENMPPGLKDIELDEYLLDDTIKDDFKKIILEIKEKSPNENVQEACSRILFLIIQTLQLKFIEELTSQKRYYAKTTVVKIINFKTKLLKNDFAK